MSLAAEPRAGKSGTGLEFHGEGVDWMGFGWHWLGYWPSDGGTDISAAKVLTLGLRCSAGKKESEFVAIAEFAQNLDDGNWHEVVIPLDRFLSGKGAAFDRKTAWELAVGTWSQTAQNLSVYLDDVAFQ